MSKKFTVIIPARLKSTRLDEKLTRFIGDKTILEHTISVAKKSNASKVIVATDSVKIKKIAEPLVDYAVMTSKNHESGTERLSECCKKLNLSEEEIIVNIQGDEPFVPSNIIDDVARNLITKNSNMSTVVCPIKDFNKINDNNLVKAVLDLNDNVIYFSRSQIPFNRDSIDDYNSLYWHHIGIYSYTVGFLHKYNDLSVSMIEKMEKLEQLRVLWNGYKISALKIKEAPQKGIDSLEDLIDAEKFYKDNY